MDRRRSRSGSAGLLPRRTATCRALDVLPVVAGFQESNGYRLMLVYCLGDSGGIIGMLKGTGCTVRMFKGT